MTHANLKILSMAHVNLHILGIMSSKLETLPPSVDTLGMSLSSVYKHLQT